MAARRQLTEAAGSVVAGAATAGGAAIAAGQSRPVLWAVAAGIILIAALGGLLLWRYRGELQRRFFAKGNRR